MEAAAALRSPLYLSQTPNLGARSRFLASPRPSSLSFDPKSRFAIGFLKSQFGSRRSIRVRASSATSSGSSSSSPIAPLQLESPVGQFLSQILISHPHLLFAAVEQQLDQLQTDREAEKKKEEPTPSGSELVLYRRISEVRAKERRRALEEILYALVVQKFVAADISLVPALSQSTKRSQSADQWPLEEEEKLEQLHSLESYEMIKNHLSLILGQRLADSNSVAPISKLRVGQVYAASVMYGYFLKRVDQRFQLEKSMKNLPWGTDEEESAIKQAIRDESRPGGPTPSWSGGPGQAGKSSLLRSYVMSFDHETLQRYATIRSKESFSIIEKHTEALFGRPEIVITPQGTIDTSKDELIKVSFAGLRRLILEAVTFGSFLWDVESYVDSRYRFVTN
ncbi:UV-B-induced protein, chloroplastic [Ananas comosus]|uniref:UV-B-induced protein, chloroplastic n=1 Tax=Ananas comosus TaxID=4615 RepID=A0A199VVI2_ANACO|nr:UV-B-induced protein, chloroplastic [Ananas comosus]OAY81242.1 UV-B-induced protein, chloroplastic [Ananas comosus]